MNNTSKDVRDDRFKEVLMHETARFVSNESNRKSLITVTNVALSGDKKRANILVSVLPESQEMAALDFLRRNIRDLAEFLEKNTKLHRIPFISFDIDQGEKNRQRIEEISKEN